ncbi:hypothetical protein AC578_2507 [Pseudocercospora eumusae]|uniref:Uncharacterized protein n=1 Tax=Pseudocercospora eumusae TaxID=321146 RepID=A0A139HXZ8_9PEZI|nr:hypothetical protein AC578_2507 [Pseudocercospora eumusae]
MQILPRALPAVHRVQVAPQPTAIISPKTPIADCETQIFSNFTAAGRCKYKDKHRLYGMEFTNSSLIDQHPEASWRQMQMPSPPLLEIENIGFVLKYNRHGKLQNYTKSSCEHLIRTEGLTLGDLANAVLEEKSGSGEVSFR